MEMTKQRKMLIGVLCLGIGGLAVDRFVIGSPESASADEGDVIAELVPDVGPAVVTLPEASPEDASMKTLPSYASLTERLIEAQERQGAELPLQAREDPFALPPQWQAQTPTPQVDTPEETNPDSATHRFTSRFKLDGTVRTTIDDKEEMMAVISGGKLDGLAVREKQRLRVSKQDGTEEVFTLIKVGPRYAIWQLDGSEETITMRVAEVLSDE